MSEHTLIKVYNLTAGYGEQAILEKVSFEVYREEIFAILGGSGCGKSTLLKHMTGLIPPISGTVTVCGVDVHQSDQDSYRRFLRNIGILYQSGGLISSMTLAENVALPIKEYTPLKEEEINYLVEMKLEQVDLKGFEHHLPSEISGGMKKRAGLARAMALNPDILFFDEPTAGLDPITSAEIDELIIKINRSLGTTMVIVTHELQSIFRLAKRVIMLDKMVKGIIAEGNPHYLRDHSGNPAVRNFFNRISTSHNATHESRS
ncbi:MAG: polyamine ABC transporter ATP-binding protein [Deltaproteobacteria bacterium CG_4_8_14_3_um_filter_51_11]|nr:ATP-binding cassette domain-containing protein [bacterium]OIP41582.1 MAG: polyamine ABC transporter ATP-binding protein [Desulfobacteraceae bacterium CG2_30_51_40]PIP48110.1 MAG: polyamine ABC transporter ATP-binding protein [Deltaproteobacteria bacterium CG23_combo_of_CG06-09_8_20_14_all_51_20]PIW00019.1 MAG: polyamine ABC transporter ATP-binding protein [Deltaproteobacteria bacterium CG17_big_fil_post_rev_8_21_14_2_50_51_6]PIX20997.1 MAG: polyamine ABC transporter ATP-binding protein [Delt